MQPWCSHSNTIYDVQLRKTLVLRTQPSHCTAICRDWVAKHKRTTQNSVRNCSPLILRKSRDSSLDAAQTSPFHCDLQSLPCKSHYNCVDQGGNPQHAAITMRSARLNCTLQWKTRPSARRTRRTDTRFPTSTLEPFCAREHTVSCDSKALNMTLTQQFHCDLQSLPYKSHYNCVEQGSNPQHAATTMRFACLNCTLQWRTRPSARRTRRTDKVPNIDAGSHFVRENIRFRAIPSAQTSPEHSSSTDCLANHITTVSTKVAIHNMQPLQSNLHPWMSLQWRTCPRFRLATATYYCPLTPYYWPLTPYYCPLTP